MSALWDVVVLAFYAPVTLGSLLWLYVRGSDYLVWRVLVGDDPWPQAMAGVAVGLLLVGITRVLARWPGVSDMAAALSRMFAGTRWWSWCLIAGASAVGEELLFRGVLQPMLGLWGASALFAVVHVPMERALWAWPLMALGIGVVLGALFEVYGSLPAPILAHATLNLLNLRWLARAATGSATASRE